MPPRRFPKREPAGRKPPPAVASSANRESIAAPRHLVTEDVEQNENYEEELAWCIHRLKLGLTAKNLTPKQMDDLRRNVSVLENPNESVVKKRCLMRTALGNYRQQMEKEKSKLPHALSAAVIAPSPSTSSQFCRKSHSSNSKFSFQPSDNSFKFNFECRKDNENDDPQ